MVPLGLRFFSLPGNWKLDSTLSKANTCHREAPSLHRLFTTVSPLQTTSSPCARRSVWSCGCSLSQWHCPGKQLLFPRAVGIKELICFLDSTCLQSHIEADEILSRLLRDYQQQRDKTRRWGQNRCGGKINFWRTQFPSAAFLRIV